MPGMRPTPSRDADDVPPYGGNPDVERFGPAPGPVAPMAEAPPMPQMAGHDRWAAWQPQGRSNVTMVAEPEHTTARRREQPVEPVFVGPRAPTGAPLKLAAVRDPAQDAARHAEEISRYREILQRHPNAVSATWNDFIDRWVTTVGGIGTAEIALQPTPPTAAAVWLLDTWRAVCDETDDAERLAILVSANKRMPALMTVDPRAAREDAGRTVSTIGRLFGLCGLPPNARLQGSDLPLPAPEPAEGER